MSTEWVPVVKKTTEETRNALKRASASHLPNRPSDCGMKPDEIKRAFWKPFLDAGGSILTELDRVAEEADGAFQKVDAAVAVLIGVLDGHDTVLAAHTERLDAHTAVLAAHTERLDAHTAALEAHEERLDGHDTKLEEHEERLDGHDTKLEEHEERLVGHESTLESQKQQLAAQGRSLATYASTLATHSGSLNEHQTELIGLRAQVDGLARSIVLGSFDLFLRFMRSKWGFTVNGESGYVGDLKTGDNILLVEHGVPDFWFEAKTDPNGAETYEYEGEKHALICYGTDGAIVGLMHIAETDYTVIANHAESAGLHAASASAASENAASAAEAAEKSRAATEALVDSIFTLQKAPSLANLNDAILLPTPTLAML